MKKSILKKLLTIVAVLMTFLSISNASVLATQSKSSSRSENIRKFEKKEKSILSKQMKKDHQDTSNMSSRMLSPRSIAGNSIFDNSNVSYPKDGEVAHGKYNFIAKVNKNTTTNIYAPSDVEVGFSNDDITPYGNKHLAVRLVSAPESAKGKVAMLYGNVGTYNGRIIDLKIVLTDWTNSSYPGAVVSFPRDQIAINSQPNYVQTKWVFLDHQTHKPTSINGFYTFNDLDGDSSVQNKLFSQTIVFDKAFNSHIDHVYVPDKNSVLKYFHDTNYDYYAGTQSVEPADTNSKFTVMYSGTSSMDLGWDLGEQIDEVRGRTTNVKTTDLSDVTAAPAKPTIDYTGRGFTGAFLGYEAVKPLKTATTIPTKLVSDKNETNVTNNTLNTVYEGYTYNITHNLPMETDTTKYSNYSLTDNLPSVLEIKSAKVYDDSNKDITSLFENKTSGTHLQFDAKAATLKDLANYNTTYRYEVKVSVKKGADLTPYVINNKIVFPNTATATVDGKSEKTKEVTTTVAVDPKEPITKKIEEGKALVDNANEKLGSDFTYEVTGKVQSITDQHKAVKDFMLEDVLEKVLDYKKLQVIDTSASNKDITAEGTTAFDKATHKLTWTAKSPESLFGHKLTTKITVDINPAADLTPYTQSDGSVKIPNKATYVYNGTDRRDTNIPKVTPQRVDHTLTKMIEK